MQLTKIGIVDPDESLRALVARIARDSVYACEFHHAFTLPELADGVILDVLICNLEVGFEQIEQWRKIWPRTKLILLIDTAQSDTWPRIQELAPSAVLSIPFSYQDLRSVLAYTDLR